ncbi:hypothetical protein CPB85DRAFT_1294472 [Mucidula mucida]|nr:hypothetical protein CPB85DRAFT_1294472 [Mucidula mucida]
MEVGKELGVIGGHAQANLGSSYKPPSQIQNDMEKGKGKSKARRVAPELHSELTEYSALLRALRTSNTMDLTTQLSRHYQENGADYYHEEPFSQNASDEEGSDSLRPTSPIAGPSTSPPPSGALKRKSSASPPPIPISDKKRQKLKVALTKWPLLLEDVSKPEWTLQEEISVMMSKIQQDDDGDDADSDDDVDKEEYLPHFALALRSRADSLQNRLNPIDWKYVLQVVGSENMMDPTVIQNAERRLRSMYGDDDNLPSASERLQTGLRARNTLAKSIAQYDDELLSIPDGDPPKIQKTRKRKLTRRNKSEGEQRRRYNRREGRQLKRNFKSVEKQVET